MKTFDSIKQKLVEAKIPFEEVTFLDEAVSARLVDSSLDRNYNPANAIKTLIISTKDGFKAVILKGKDRIDEFKLKDIVGKWSFILKTELIERFEFLPGCVCPLDLNLPFLIDKSVLNLKIWSMGAGDKKKGLNIASEIVLKNIKSKQIVFIRSIL
jgi:prolyl-tRNA editing enzyme YbaK/EbsC (Cys-tRNA(Pro) deacylase)